MRLELEFEDTFEGATLDAYRAAQTDKVLAQPDPSIPPTAT
jgi:hypothetical protein